MGTKVYRGAWTDADEIAFIDGLGTFASREVLSKRRVSRLELLLRYKGAMPVRQNWDGIDRGRVIFALNNAIAQAQA